MDTSEVIKMEPDENCLNHDHPITGSTKKSSESAMRRNESRDTNSETHSTDNNMCIQGVDRTNILKTDKIDNEMCHKSLQSNDSQQENVTNLTQTEETDNRLPFIKVEPAEDKSKNRDSSQNVSQIVAPRIKLVADYQSQDDFEGETMDTTDKEKEVEVILEVKKGDKKPPVIDVNSDDDTSDSSSDSSDSKSSSSDDSSSLSLSGGEDTDVEEEEERY